MCCGRVWPQAEPGLRGWGWLQETVYTMMEKELSIFWAVEGLGAEKTLDQEDIK